MATTVRNRRPRIGPARSMEMARNTVHQVIIEKADIETNTLPITAHTDIRTSGITGIEMIGATNTMARRAIVAKMIIDDRIPAEMTAATQIEIVILDTTRTTMAIKTDVKV